MPPSISASGLSSKVEDEKSLKLGFILKGIFMPCLLRLDTIIVKGSPICCSSAQTFGLVGQFGLNVDSPSITCFGCAALITCSTRLHLLLTCIYISSLQQTVSTHQGRTDNCIGRNVKFNLETNPYSNGPKVKVNLTAGAY